MSNHIALDHHCIATVSQPRLDQSRNQDYACTKILRVFIKSHKHIK